MQIAARNADICVPRGIANLGEGSTTSQGVTDKRVPAVVDGQRPEPSRRAKDPAGSAESLAESVTGERFDGATRDQRRQERLVVLGAGA